ncbi:MAG: hypothetical protein AAGC67_20355 [Myxococcota bacterium]
MVPAPHPSWTTLVACLGLTLGVAAGGAEAAGGVEAEGGAGAERAPAAERPVYVTLGTGFDFSRGDFGLERDSTLYYVPFDVTVDVASWRLVLRVPFLHSDGVVGLAVGGPTGLESDRVSGLGDSITSVAYLFAPPNAVLPWVEVTGQISWPTRTREPLGQGGFAFAAQLDAFQRYGDWTPFARVGRNFYTVGSLDDRFYTAIGVSHAWTASFATGLSYDWLESVAPGLKDGHELVPFASFDLEGGWNFDPYAVIGLSSGSPDYGIGFAVRFER